MSILICGASSSIGRDLCDLLERENIGYDGTYYRCRERDPAFCDRDNMFQVDFTNQEEVSTFFTANKSRWRVCVFLVAERNIDTCEQSWNTAIRMNVDTVDYMSGLCAKEGIYFIHLSTDYDTSGYAGVMSLEYRLHCTKLLYYSNAVIIYKSRFFALTFKHTHEISETCHGP